MPNPKVNKSAKIKGVWLLPYTGRGKGIDQDHRVYVQADGLDLETPISANIFEAPSRAGKLVQLGRVHGQEGHVTGLLLSAHGQTAKQWANDLHYLIHHQEDYGHISLVSPDEDIHSVAFAENYTCSPQVGPTKKYKVDISFLELL